MPVEQLPEPRDVRLERVGSRRRRVGAPDLVDQALERHDLACPERGEPRARRAALRRRAQSGSPPIETSSGPRTRNSTRRSSMCVAKHLRTLEESPFEPVASALQARSSRLRAACKPDDGRSTGSSTERSSHVELAARARRSRRHHRRSRDAGGGWKLMNGHARAIARLIAPRSRWSGSPRHVGSPEDRRDRAATAPS